MEAGDGFILGAIVGGLIFLSLGVGLGQHHEQTDAIKAKVGMYVCTTKGDCTFKYGPDIWKGVEE
jgi:hypothetical protein